MIPCLTFEEELSVGFCLGSVGARLGLLLEKKEKSEESSAENGKEVDFGLRTQAIGLGETTASLLLVIL